MTHDVSDMDQATAGSGITCGSGAGILALIRACRAANCLCFLPSQVLGMRGHLCLYAKAWNVIVLPHPGQLVRVRNTSREGVNRGVMCSCGSQQSMTVASSLKLGIILDNIQRTQRATHSGTTWAWEILWCSWGNTRTHPVSFAILVGTFRV